MYLTGQRSKTDLSDSDQDGVDSGSPAKSQPSGRDSATPRAVHKAHKKHKGPSGNALGTRGAHQVML